MRASERAYLALRDDILHWRLEPGTVLAEVEQSERLGVSRTPLREALGRLAADGLVATQRGRGLVVTGVSTDTIVQLFELRQVLEQQAARLAAQRRDADVFEALRDEFTTAPDLLDDRDPEHGTYYDLVSRFDSAVDDATGNPYLVGALRTLRPQLVRIRRVSRDDRARLRAAAGEHQLIVEAIAHGDAALAASATHVHLHNSLRNVLASAERKLA
ncbi:MAG: GntR family transcriptional regulator [Salinibacterium sp.]|nr:GntR family transcriptional regulator [Salinibacterium sp.]